MPGTAGSGVPPLMDALMDVHRMDPKKARLSHLEQTPATHPIVARQAGRSGFRLGAPSPHGANVAANPGYPG